MSSTPKNEAPIWVDISVLMIPLVGLVALGYVVNSSFTHWDGFDDAIDDLYRKFNDDSIHDYSFNYSFSNSSEAQLYRFDLLQFYGSNFLQKLDSLIAEYEVKYLQDPSDPNYAEYQAEYTEYLQYRDELKKGLSDLETLRSSGTVTAEDENEIRSRIDSAMRKAHWIRW
jgi:hypothetical protein